MTPMCRVPRYRLLAIDIDGTLVDLDDQITQQTHAALDRAAAAGVAIVLATGRRYARALPVVQRLGLDLPLITASGALIKHPADHRTLFRADLPPETVRRVVQIIEAAGYEAILYADSYGEGYDFYCARTEATSAELLEFFQRNAGAARLWPDLACNPPSDIFAGFAMGTREQMLALEQELQAALPGQLYTHVLRSPKYTGYMCEIAPSGVTKWTGILRLADSWGIGASEICAVGDDVNDIPMIQGAGLGVAMGNALPEVKAAADRVAPRHDEDGLVTVVEWLLSE
jgi:Cof subfamily protein (haloacid dehalogenase superfamily)